MFPNVRLKLLAGIVSAVLLAVTSAEARPNPQMTCKGAYGGQVRCEAKYVWPFIPEWTAGETEYGKGFGEGFGMTMKIGEGWTLISMEVHGQFLEVEARVVSHKAQFRSVQTQIASQPP